MDTKLFPIEQAAEMIKNLSENQDFGKDQLSTGKVKESEVILLFFLESVPGADAND